MKLKQRTSTTLAPSEMPSISTGRMRQINGHNKKIYLDTDVLISSCLSKNGAAFWLLNRIIDLQKFINPETKTEFEKVCERLDIYHTPDFFNTFRNIEQGSSGVDYNIFLNDSGDKHILSGAADSDVEYLITYNMKDYKANQIFSEFDIIIMTPGQFLQYLRSLN